MTFRNHNVPFCLLFLTLIHFVCCSIPLQKRQTDDSINLLYTSNYGNPTDIYSPALIVYHESSSTLVVSIASLTPSNYSQVFVGLLDKNSGLYLDNITIVGDDESVPVDIIITGDDVYICGATKGSNFDNHSIPTTTIQAGFVIKFHIDTTFSSPSLQKDWSIVFGGAAQTVATSLAIHDSFLITYGSTNGPMDSVPSFQDQLYVRKTTLEGDWVSTVFVEVGFATPRKMVVDSAGNAYAVAISAFDSSVCPGGYASSFDILLMKLNSTMGLEWCQQIGSFSDDDVAEIILQEDIGTLILIGYADFSNVKDSSGTVLENGFGSNDAIVLKYSMNTGVFQNGTFLGTPGADFGLGISLNSGNNLLALINTEDTDEFHIYKFGPNSLESVFNFTAADSYQFKAGGIVAEPSRKGYFYTVGLTTTSVQPCTLITSGYLDTYPDASDSSPSNSKKKKVDVGLIVGVTVAGAVVLVGAVVGFVQVRRIRQRRKALNEDIPLSNSTQPVNSATANYTGIETPADSRPPTQVVQAKDITKQGGWEIDFSELQFVKELGKGAFGVVYLCRWRNTDCATKQLDFGQDEQCVQRFLKEAENVKSLKPHPNVCTVLGVCTNPSNPICIVMEYLPDGNLEDLIYEKKISMDGKRLVEFAKDVASGMTHLHAENILHCDLACRNLLVAAKGTNKYQIKIADFGLSRVLSAETYTVSRQATFPTRWTAPETFKTGKISRANDVWSFGVVLWEMMEGRRPYMEYSNPEVVQKVSEGYRLPKPEMHIPDSLWNLIEACWETDPNKRPSFNEIYQELSHLE